LFVEKMDNDFFTLDNSLCYVKELMEVRKALKRRSHGGQAQIVRQAQAQRGH